MNRYMVISYDSDEPQQRQCFWDLVNQHTPELATKVIETVRPYAVVIDVLDLAAVVQLQVAMLHDRDDEIEKFLGDRRRECSDEGHINNADCAPHLDDRACRECGATQGEPCPECGQSMEAPPYDDIRHLFTCSHFGETKEPKP